VDSFSPPTALRVPPSLMVRPQTVGRQSYSKLYESADENDEEDPIPEQPVALGEGTATISNEIFNLVKVSPPRSPSDGPTHFL
jgi:hypothetical protein